MAKKTKKEKEKQEQIKLETKTWCTKEELELKLFNTDIVIHALPDNTVLCIVSNDAEIDAVDRAKEKIKDRGIPIVVLFEYDPEVEKILSARV